jgi:exopolysaccharide biosynthesis polyprenyl glycosylphosphotransferase
MVRKLQAISRVLVIRTMMPQLAARLRPQDREELGDHAGEHLRSHDQLYDAALDLAELATPELGPVDGGAVHSASLVWREKLHRRLLAAIDTASVVLALGALASGSAQRHVWVTLIVGAIGVVVLFKVAGLYDRDDLRLVHSTLDEVPMLVQLTGLFAMGIGILQTVALNGTFGADRIAAVWAAAFVSIALGRVLARALAARIAPVERCLVIGEPTRCNRIRDKLADSRVSAHVVASLQLEAGEDADWVEMRDTIRHLVRELNVDRIIIAPATTDAGGVANLIRTAKAVGARVSILPRMFEVVGSAVEFDDVDGMTMLGVRRFGLSRSSRLLKRMFDVVLGSLILVLISPVLALIALAIQLDSRGPVFFRQVRVGRDGEHFDIVKFRSMVAGADARRDELRSRNEAGQGLFKIAEDPRVTRVGRLLRRASLDELPQLLNVVRGEMSLVGPRPLVIDEDILVRGLDRSRLYLTPGMTGPWQILGYRVPMQEMVGIDYLYVANWTLWLDLKVLLRTVRHVACRANA